MYYCFLYYCFLYEQMCVQVYRCTVCTVCILIRCFVFEFYYCCVAGGKAMWLDFVDSVPAAWTVCGLWITYSRIAGMITTTLTAAGTGCITYIIKVLY